MSYYCKGRNCPKKEDCMRAMAYEAFPDKETEEGMASGVWYVNELTCMDNQFSEGVFPKNKN